MSLQLLCSGMAGKATSLPLYFCAVVGAGLVYDYFVDMKATPIDLRSWSDIVPSFTYEKTKPFFQMLVPTIDTVRFSSLLDICVSVERSVLFTGVSLDHIIPKATS